MEKGITDHIPEMVYGPQTGTFFSKGHMKGLIDSAISDG